MNKNEYKGNTGFDRNSRTENLRILPVVAIFSHDGKILFIILINHSVNVIGSNQVRND